MPVVGFDSSQNLSQFEELRGPALRYGGSIILSLINDAYSATWVSLNILFFRFGKKENSFIRTKPTGH